MQSVGPFQKWQKATKKIKANNRIKGKKGLQKIQKNPHCFKGTLELFKGGLPLSNIFEIGDHLFL